MKKRWIMAMCMVLALGMVMIMGGCKKEEQKTTPPNEETTKNPLTQGIYKAEEADLLNSFIRFNEDGTYYGMFFSGGVLEAGTYELVDEELKYFTGPGPDEDYHTEEDNETAVASKVVVLTTYQGAVQKVAYVEDSLKDMSLGGMANNRTLVHNADYAYDPEKEELPISILVLYANGGSGSTLTLYHNGTFMDYTGEIGEEGTWEKTGEGTYSLVSEEAKDTVYTLKITEKGATYTKGEGDTQLSSSLE